MTILINQRYSTRILVILTILTVLWLCACGKSTSQPEKTPSIPASPTVKIPTPAIPTVTTESLAAVVNGENITLAQYEAEVSRYSTAIGTELATEQKQQVLDDLINQILLAQAATESGFIADNATVQERFDQLVAQLGDRKTFDEWMQNNDYHEADFKADLKRNIAAAWMRDQISNQAPEEMEQIHARQILLYNSDIANQVMEQLRLGGDFVKIAAEYDPTTFGDLGWFPRGYLLDDKLEEVVFNLQPGEFSDIIQTTAGFHIVQVIDRNGLRTVDPAIRLTMQEKALNDWLAEHRLNSQIQIITP